MLTNDGRLEWFLSALDGKKSQLTQQSKEKRRREQRAWVEQGKPRQDRQRQELLLRFFAVQRLQSPVMHDIVHFHLDLNSAPDSTEVPDPFRCGERSGSPHDHPDP